MILSLIIYQAQYIELKIVDENNNPIEGVYAVHNDKFWYSDKDGIIKIAENQIDENDSIRLSHLSYKPVGILFKNLVLSDMYPNIQLKSDMKELPEVSVSVFNAAKYVEEAIKKIPSNYVDPYETTLNLNADITFNRTDKRSELIRYKGLLQLSSEKKDIYVAKKPEFETVSPELHKNIFFMKPYQSLSIISINTHHIIRRYKKYNFENYEFIEYKNKDAVKIYFKEKGKNPWIGNLIIDRETMAILSINYSVGYVNPWIVGTIKGKGIVKTAINKYYVEANYEQGLSGKYLFDSGRENINSINRWKDQSVATSSNVYLKRNTDMNIDLQKNKKKIKDVFYIYEWLPK